MPRFQFKVSQAMGQHGCYAMVEIEAEMSNEIGKLTVATSPDCAAEYRSAAIYGMEYAWEHAPREVKKERGVTVVLRQVESAPIDTTSIMVVYAAASALWEALAVHPQRRPLIDGPNIGIFFPR